MREFLKTYQEIFLLLPILYILGNVHPILAIPPLLFVGINWVNKGKDTQLFLLLVIILILGDNRSWQLLFVKNLRIVMILLVFIRSLTLVSSGVINFRRVFLMTIPFFIIAFLGGLNSPSIGLSEAKMISYLLLIFAVLHFVPYLLRQSNGEILYDLIRISILVFVIGLILRQVNPSLGNLGGRYRGILGNPNGLGIYATLMFPIYFIYQDLKPKNKRLIYWAIFLCIFSVVLSGSRTALGTIGIFYILHFFHKRNRLAITGFYVMILPAALLFLSGGGLERIVSLFGLEEYLRVESLLTGTGRYLAWSMGLQQIAQNPIIGRGFAWEEIFFHDMRDILIMTEHQGGMHNSYLTFIMNNGYLGFTFFIIFLIYLMGRMKAPYYGMPFAVAAILSSFFESWLNSSLNAFSIHFFTVVMVLIEYPKLVKKSKEKT